MDSITTNFVDSKANGQVQGHVVGHSLGTAVATLNAADIVSNGLNQHGACPVTAVAFACPRVEDSGFRKLFDELPGLRLLRVCNSPDVVPKYPPMGYSDVGVELPVAPTDRRRHPLRSAPSSPSTPQIGAASRPIRAPPPPLSTSTSGRRQGCASRCRLLLSSLPPPPQIGADPHVLRAPPPPPSTSTSRRRQGCA
uniref:Phospholipase A1 n=1 Tax=Oryza meridionalis TaxID=40149 RepID=A0A0E0F9W5_9ORYZ